MKKDEYGRKIIGDFVPTKIAKRLKYTIDFSVKIDLRATSILDKLSPEHLFDLKQFDSEGKDFFKETSYDYEEIPVLRDHKIKCLESILKNNVDRKYKISFFKGVQLILEALIMMLLMVSIAVKANVYALIYLVFIYKFAIT